MLFSKGRTSTGSANSHNSDYTPDKVLNFAGAYIGLVPAGKQFGLYNASVLKEVFSYSDGGNKYNIKRIIRAGAGRLFSVIFLISSLAVFLLVPECVIRGKVFTSSIVEGCERVIKRSIDILGAIVGLSLSSVLFLIVSILIKLDSPGPVFYVQKRVGLNRRRKERRQNFFEVEGDRRNGDRRKTNLCGKPFNLYKFRTMREGAEKKSGPVWASPNDPRVTRVGRFLRATHIDEIPQFLNILKGEMSLVGPRPERPCFVSDFVKRIPGYGERLIVKPGLTGKAQINCGYDGSIEDVKNKLKYDLDYVRDGSLTTDLGIIAKTFWMMFNGRGDI